MSLRTHIPALLLAFVIGVATGLPQIIFVQQMGDSYQGIFPTTSNDDYYYEARAQEIRDGYILLGNPFLYEYREADPVAFWMPDAFISLSGQLLGLSVQHTFVLYDFVLPPVLFLISYLLLLRAIGNRIWSLLGAGIFHLGLFLDAFVRSPSPQLNFLFVEMSLLFALFLLQSKPFAKYALAATLGALFYVYPYYWTFAYGSVGMFFLATLLRKELRPYSLPLFASLAAGTLIGLPTLLQMLISGKSLAYQETISRLGMIESHTPAGFNSIILSLGILTLIAGIMYFLPESRKEKTLWFFGSLVMGGIIAANNQIITGKNLEFSSHYFLPVAYVVFIALMYTLHLACTKWAKLIPENIAYYLPRVGVASAILVISVGGALSFVGLTNLSENEITSQKYAPILTWLKENAAPEEVVMADEHLSVLIAAYTPLRIFYSRQANLHVMTDEEAWTRLLLMHRGANLDDDFFSKNVGQIFGAHYFDEYGHEMQLNKVRRLFGYPIVQAEIIPTSAKKQFRDFAATLEKESAEELMSSRRLDYVITEPGFAMPTWINRIYPGVHEVYSAQGFAVFSLR